MMNFLKSRWDFLIFLFSLFPKPVSAKQHLLDLEQIHRRLVMRLSSDVLLQQGKWATAEELAARRAAVLNYDF